MRKLIVIAALAVVVSGTTACGGGGTEGLGTSSRLPTTRQTVATTTSTTTPTTAATTTSSSSTTTTSTTTTTTTTLPVTPLVAAGYEAAEVRTVCVAVTQTYRNVEEFTAPLYDLVDRSLEAMGVSVVGSGGVCDASLTFDVEGRALSDRYSGDDGTFTDYGGASYRGFAEFAISEVGSEYFDFNGRIDPSFLIAELSPEPSDAPFAAAFTGPLLTTLEKLWGAKVAVTSIGEWPAHYEAGRGWLLDAAADVLPQLLELRLSSAWQVRLSAYEALGEIVAERAIPAADRASVIRALIADLVDPNHEASAPLNTIACRLDDCEAGFELDDAGFYVPWDADRWTEWADAMGY